jgi:succinate-semialdehyde dehydrogenase / glutarate-semialdehyde dehydrogenase
MMTFTTINPATEEVIKEYGHMSQSEAVKILDDVHKAFLEWRTLSVQQRASYFTKLAGVLRNNKEPYAQLITQEMGKPIIEARAEIEKCAWTADVYAEKGEQWLREEVLEADGREHRVIYQPLKMLFQTSLSESTIFIREALKAGSIPPASPIKRENDMALIIIPGVIAKLKASSENV